MQFIGAIIQFLKKHYEKIILCVVLLGLAAAAIWMGAKITEVKDETNPPITEGGRGKTLAPLDLTADLQALAEITNPPPVILSGEHNLFNPVTWKRMNGGLRKIIKTGPDALTVTKIDPLYTVIAFDHASGNGGVYIMSLQIHSAKKPFEYAEKDSKPKSGLYVIHGIKGAPDDPTDLHLEIPATQETVWISKTNPYKHVDGYTVDMKYDPESLVLLKKRINDTITLDNEQYKMIEITNNLIRVQSISNTKITTIKWNESP
jgi:hypothetical protein